MHRVRRGMSLIEITVVIAIVGVLCGLLLPAVQQAREAARRLRCASHLKQIGLAMNNYHSAFGSLPMGYVAASSRDPLATSPGWGWAALVLPQIDQAPLYDAANFNLPVESAANLTARTTAVAVYSCPSDRDHGGFTVVNDWAGPIGRFQTNSFAACFGAGLEIDASPGLGNGLFRRNLVARFADILDGSSSTIAVGERGACLVKTPWAGAPSGGTSSISSDAPSVAAGYVGNGHGGELVLARVSTVGLNDFGTGPDDFYSPHPGGANFLFADGSARFVSNSITLPVFRALCTRAGGEVISDGSY